MAGEWEVCREWWGVGEEGTLPMLLEQQMCARFFRDLGLD